MKLSRLATRLAVILSLPFVGVGLMFELLATFASVPGAKADGYELGDGIYFFLGYPLTRLLFIFIGQHSLQDNDNWWAVPLLSALFITQWIIWAQLISLVSRCAQNLWLFLQPSPSESSAAETIDDVGTFTHEFPQESVTMIFHHQHDWALIDAVVPGREPAACGTVISGKGRIERGFQTVAVFADFGFFEMLQRGQNDLWRERQ